MEYYWALKRKEIVSFVCYNMDETWGHFSTLNVSYKKEKKAAWFHSHEVVRIVVVIETESRIVVARG